MVQQVHPGGVAASDGRLRPGHVILMVGRVNFDRINHEEAVRVLQMAQGETEFVVMQVGGGDATSGDQADDDLDEVCPWDSIKVAPWEDSS